MFLALVAPSPTRAFSLFDALASLTSGVANAAGALPAPVTNTPALKAALNQNPNPLKTSDLAIANGVALTASSGPLGSLADIEAEKPGGGEIALYVVRPGDTIGAIAKMYSVSVNTIIWANDLGYKGVIRPGEALIILPVTGVEYTVKKGDTLASVAKKYGGDASEIAQFNGLNPDVPLAVGDGLIIPGGEIAAPTAVAARAATARQPIIGAGAHVIPGYYAIPVSGIVTQSLHGWNAVDIGAPTGTAVRAAASGTVIIARESGWNGGLGDYVVIAHPNGTQTLYAHASRVLVSVGQAVSQGQTIMLVGASGLSTGPHVHFEVRGAGNPVAGVPPGSRL